MAIAVKRGACINELSSMDPLLEAPLRLASISSPKGVSTTQEKDAVKFFIEDYKLRAGNNTNSSAPDTQDVSNSGGVLMSQLIQLCNGLDASSK